MRYFLFLMFFVLFSCNSIKLGVIKKNVIAPGRPNMEFKIKYSTQIITKNDISIKSLTLADTRKELSYVVTNLSNGRMLKKGEVLKEGQYYIEIDTDYTDKKSKSIDTIVFRFKIKNREKIIKKSTVIGKIILMK